MLPEWNLHYARWVIEDGEPDRSVAEVFDWFAVTFWTEQQLSAASNQTKSVVPVSDYRYRVVAEVTYLSDSASIIDFGLAATASSHLLPQGCKEGNYVTGEIYLNLPLCTEVGPEDVFKALACTWRVNRISADMTAYVPSPAGGLRRDASHALYQDVLSTDSVRTHSYVLHCSEAKPE